MKLKTISEIQHKFPTTCLDRANVAGVYATASMNDYLHLVHDGDGHAKKHKQRKKPTKK